MRKNFSDYFAIACVLLSVILTLATTLYIEDGSLGTIEIKDYRMTMIYFVLVVVCMTLSVTSLFLTRRKLNIEEKDTEALKKWIRYDKKRKEIEEEMSILTKQLMASDMSRYIDVNRMIFDAQIDGYRLNSEMINYGAFLEQFGINGSKITIRKDSAVFLTPFDIKGEVLFKQCQEILGKLDIFLQKSDAFVEKDDIMMNIVSLIVQSEIVIVNINGRNPNVYYELGIAHALGKPTILLSEMNKPIEELGFDIRQKKIIMYHTQADLEEQLLYQVSRIKKRI